MPPQKIPDGRDYDYVISLDPGLRECGLAVFDALMPESKLIYAALVENTVHPPVRGLEAWHGMALEVEKALWRGCIIDRELNGADILFVSEEPIVRLPKHQKGDQDDIIQLAGVVGAVGAQAGLEEWTRASLKPEVWKGNIDPDIILARIEKRLRPEEIAVIQPCARSKRHNVLDAIGIGLFVLGRLKKERL
jgi:hypothetical protein